jgi:hypothetical protein
MWLDKKRNIYSCLNEIYEASGGRTWMVHEKNQEMLKK